MKGVVSMISFSVHLSLIYKRANEGFFLWGGDELNFYAATLVKVFIICRHSLVEFLGSFMYTILSSVTSDTLTSSFPT